MNSKQWLGRGRWIEREITALMKTRDETRDRLMKITQSYDGDGAQSTKDPHKFDALIEMEDKLDAAIDKLYQTKNEILSVIDQLEDGRERIALRAYYIDMKTWEEVAVVLKYTWRQTMRIRKTALENAEKIIASYNVI